MLSATLAAVLAGYVVAELTGRPAFGMAAIALLGVPVGAAAGALRGAMVRGALLGLVGGFAVCMAVNHLRVRQAFRAGPPGSRPATSASRPATAASAPASGPAWEFREQWVVSDRETTAILATTAFLCMGVAGVFGHLAAKRRQLTGR